MKLPLDVRLLDLQPHADGRGRLTEIFRCEWNLPADPIQWNLVSSEAGVLRGVHVHPRHDDYLLLAAGSAVIGLRDLRDDSPTNGRAMEVTFTAAHPQAIFSPHGVAHGFYFPEPSIHIYSVTSYWAHDDELGCHWSDPELGIHFPCDNPMISPRDAGLPALAELLDQLRAARIQ